MKKIILIVFYLFTGYIGVSQTLDCAKFKDGKFRIPGATEAEGSTFIDRKGNYQVESNETLKFILKFKVVWLDECTYTLKLDSVIKNEKNFPLQADMVVKVKITGTLKESYLQESSVLNLPVFKSEVFKIR